MRKPKTGDEKAILLSLKEAGFFVKRDNGNHVIWHHEDGRRFATALGSGQPRAARNALRDLKRMGITIIRPGRDKSTKTNGAMTTKLETTIKTTHLAHRLGIRPKMVYQAALPKGPLNRAGKPKKPGARNYSPLLIDRDMLFWLDKQIEEGKVTEIKRCKTFIEHHMKRLDEDSPEPKKAEKPTPKRYPWKKPVVTIPEKAIDRAKDDIETFTELLIEQNAKFKKLEERIEFLTTSLKEANRRINHLFEIIEHSGGAEAGDGGSTQLAMLQNLNKALKHADPESAFIALSTVIDGTSEG